RSGQRRFVCSAAHVDARVSWRANWTTGLRQRRICLAPAVRSFAEGTRTNLMTGDHRNRFTLHNSKDVPQFAPNFSVYVLPPDVVCLYSEDRKFFLHGELYCALAAAIGKGRKSFRELVRELEKDFPSDKIHEA